MPFLIGITLALAVAGSARWIGLDRDRAFYPTVMIVIASYYVLFATMAASSATLTAEIGVSVGFAAMAVVGFKKNLWFVVIALAAHGIYDFFHPHAIPHSGAPQWWPDFCAAYDLAAAAVLGLQLRNSPKQGGADRPNS